MEEDIKLAAWGMIVASILSAGFFIYGHHESEPRARRMAHVGAVALFILGAVFPLSVRYEAYADYRRLRHPLLRCDNVVNLGKGVVRSVLPKLNQTETVALLEFPAGETYLCIVPAGTQKGETLAGTLFFFRHEGWTTNAIAFGEKIQTNHANSKLALH